MLYYTLVGTNLNISDERNVKMIQSEKIKYEKNSTVSFFDLSFFSQKHIDANSRQTSSKYIDDC